ncbi:hypothetical protein [Nitrosococcus wardiae]|nr:hypothetical protein [Nitrosococcus wardiae]
MSISGFLAENDTEFLPSENLILLSQNKQLIEMMAYEIAWRPNDLQTHVRRLLLSISCRDGAQSYGALLDLYIALGEKGRQLRQRMLLLASPMLTAEQNKMLREKLEQGVSRFDSMPVSVESILTEAVIGSTKLVHRKNVLSNNKADLLVEAKEFLAYGQVQEAQDLLEQLCLRDPTDIEVTEELLSIYKHGRDQQALSKMTKCLEEQGFPLPPQWEALAEQLNKTLKK